MRLQGDILIRRPPDTVFDFVADERNNYDPTIQDAVLLTGEPLGVGTRFRCTSKRRGRVVEMIVEITGYDRPHRLSTTARSASLVINSDLRFEPAAGGTALRWTSDLQPSGALRLLTPAIALFGPRQTATIWANLEHTLESATDIADV